MSRRICGVCGAPEDSGLHNRTCLGLARPADLDEKARELDAVWKASFRRDLLFAVRSLVAGPKMVQGQRGCGRCSIGFVSRDLDGLVCLSCGFRIYERRRSVALVGGTA